MVPRSAAEIEDEVVATISSSLLSDRGINPRIDLQARHTSHTYSYLSLAPFFACHVVPVRGKPGTALSSDVRTRCASSVLQALLPLHDGCEAGKENAILDHGKAFLMRLEPFLSLLFDPDCWTTRSQTEDASFVQWRWRCPCLCRCCRRCGGVRRGCRR